MSVPLITMHLTATDYLPDGFPLALRMVSQQPDYPFHTHDFTEIVVVMQGHGTHDLPQQSYSIAAGDVFVIPQGQAHRFRDTHGLSIINVMYRTSALVLPPSTFTTVPGYHALFVIEPHLRARGHSHGHLRISAEQFTRLRGWLDELSAELTARAPGYALIAQGQLTRLIVMLARWYHALVDKTAQPVLTLGQLHQYLLHRLADPVTIPEIAEYLHCAPRTLQRHCLALLGQTPLQYLTTLRLQEAARLLCETDGSITSIAGQVGYADSAYFSRQFHAGLGCSPRAYRQAHGSLQPEMRVSPALQE